MAREQSGRSGGARALIFMAASLIAGVAALVLVYKLIDSYQQRIAEAQRPDETVLAIVAARDLYQGVVITEEDLYAIKIPQKFLHSDVYQSPEHVVGRIPKERILANEFLREERLADASEGVGLNAIIQRGMRAISINVADGSALSGFLNPGNYVDVLVTMDPEAGFRGASPTTTTLLQAMYVLAVDDRLSNVSATENTRAARRKRRRIKPSVTLAVTPDHAEALAHAEKLGTVTLALRNDMDVATVETKSATARDILGEAPPPTPRPKSRPQKKQEPESPGLQIIRGSESEEVK